MARPRIRPPGRSIAVGSSLTLSEYDEMAQAAIAHKESLAGFIRKAIKGRLKAIHAKEEASTLPKSKNALPPPFQWKVLPLGRQEDAQSDEGA